jgi:CubicO group peptidase (beta-lactamase class C family)
MRSRLLLTTVVVLGFHSPAGAQNPAPITGEKAQRIDAVFAWATAQSPGCAIGVSQNGAVVYSRSYGMANLEYDIPINPDSVFDVASVSKQFTGFSIGLLASEGKLSLDDDVRRYLPELPDYGQRITIRQLLTHTSGLRNTGDLFDLAGWRVNQRNPTSSFAASPLQEPVTEDDVLRMAVRQKSLDFRPGAEFLYNNTAYTLLGVIVKRVSGLSLRDFAKARIFGPLDMRDTHFRDDPNIVVPRRTSGYRPRPEGGWWISSPLSTTVGAWGLETTVGDLLKWEQNFVDARVGGRGVLDEMQRPGRLDDGTLTGYGFGVWLGVDGRMRRVRHGGGDFGYAAELAQYYSVHDPSQHVAVATLCNGRSISASSLARRVVEIVVGSEMLGTGRPVGPLAPAVSIAEAELSALAGTYRNPVGGAVLRLVVRNGRLIPEGADEAYVPVGNRRFRVGELPIEVLFTSPVSGEPQTLQILGLIPAPTVRYVRVTPVSYSVAELTGFVGQYRSDELDATYTVKLMPEGGLAVFREKVEPVPLTTITRDIFYGQSLGSSVTFERAPAGDVSGLIITANTPRRLVFTKIVPAASRSK